MAPTSTSTRSSPLSAPGFPSLSPSLRWTLVAIIVISFLLIMVWLAYRCYSHKALRHEHSMTDALDETESTAEGLSRFSLPVFLRRPRKLAGQGSAFCEKAAAEEAREGALTDIEIGAHDTVIEITEHSRHLPDEPSMCIVPLKQDARSAPAPLAENSGHTLLSRSRNSASTVSVYSQDSGYTSLDLTSLLSDTSTDSTSSSPCSPLFTATVHAESFSRPENDLQVPAPAVLSPKPVIKMLRDNSPALSCASMLFLDTEPNPVFELAATAHGSSDTCSAYSTTSSFASCFSNDSLPDDSDGSRTSNSDSSLSSHLPSDVDRKPHALSSPASSAVLSTFLLSSPPLVKHSFGHDDV